MSSQHILPNQFLCILIPIESLGQLSTVERDNVLIVSNGLNTVLPYQAIKKPPSTVDHPVDRALLFQKIN